MSTHEAAKRSNSHQQDAHLIACNYFCVQSRVCGDRVVSIQVSLLAVDLYSGTSCLLDVLDGPALMAQHQALQAPHSMMMQKAVETCLPAAWQHHHA